MLKKSLLGTAVALSLLTASTAFAHGPQQLDGEIRLLFAAEQDGTGSTSIEAPKLGTWGFDTAGMDRSVKPGADFFAYSGGTWAKNTQIPPTRAAMARVPRAARPVRGARTCAAGRLSAG